MRRILNKQGGTDRIRRRGCIAVSTGRPDENHENLSRESWCFGLPPEYVRRVTAETSRSRKDRRPETLSDPMTLTS
jgi:hypothetical protein